MTLTVSDADVRHMAVLHRVAQGASALAIVVGSAVLIGWWLDFDPVKRVLPGMVAMNPLTALAFIVAGVALRLLRADPPDLRARRLAQGCGLVIALIGLLKLSDIVLGSELGLDQLLFREKLSAGGTGLPNQIAPNTALSFLLVGSALLLLDRPTRRGPWPAQILALGAGFIALLSLIGYIFGIPSFYGVGAFIPMAVHTAFTFLALAGGILGARPARGFMAVLVSDTLGGLLARRLLPAILGLPAVLGWLRLAGQQAGFYTTEQGTLLLVGAITLIFVILVAWQARILYDSDSERRRAEAALRQLNVQLASRQQELEELTMVLQEQTQRVERHAAELAETNRALAQKNDENEMFVYSVSHDLRSPLVNLEGFSQELAMVGQDLCSLLKESDVPPAVRQRGVALVEEDMATAIQFIQTGVRRLSGIIDALLRLSRAGRVDYQWQQVDINLLVSRIVQSMNETVSQQGTVVTVQELPPSWGDPTALDQAFANLIGNALKYRDPSRPSHIEIGSLPLRGKATNGATPVCHTYYVKDNGLGIPKVAQDKVFQIFQRLHPNAAPGEGLGLTLVRRIIERHGGSIWVESTQGEGSTFFVELPEQPGDTSSDAR